MVMKLLPKPRGKVPRRPILGTVQEQKNRFNYIETKKSYFGKKLAYNDFSKKIIKENPGIIKAVEFLSSHKLERRFLDSKDRFEILRVTNDIIDEQKKRGNFTTDAFVIKINFERKKHIFFLKEQEINSTEELILLKSIEGYAHQFGLNIVQPHFAFDNNIEHNSQNRPDKHYIIYDFTDKLTVYDAFKLNKISLEESRAIRLKLISFERLLNKNHSIPIENLDTKNCFIDLSKKPPALYLFDPMVTPFTHPLFGDLNVSIQFNKLKNKFKK